MLAIQGHFWPFLGEKMAIFQQKQPKNQLELQTFPFFIGILYGCAYEYPVN